MGSSDSNEAEVLVRALTSGHVETSELCTAVSLGFFKKCMEELSRVHFQYLPSYNPVQWAAAERWLGSRAADVKREGVGRRDKFTAVERAFSRHSHLSPPVKSLRGERPSETKLMWERSGGIIVAHIYYHGQRAADLVRLDDDVLESWFARDPDAPVKILRRCLQTCLAARGKREQVVRDMTSCHERVEGWVNRLETVQ